jgi:hypothetical protein
MLWKGANYDGSLRHVHPLARPPQLLQRGPFQQQLLNLPLSTTTSASAASLAGSSSEDGASAYTTNEEKNEAMVMDRID